MSVSAAASGRGSDAAKQTAVEHNYFPISSDTLNPDVLTDFRVYLKRGKHYVLYTKEREHFSERLKQRLMDNGIQTVYIPYDQQALYEDYVVENFEWILNDTSIPLDVRSKVFLDGKLTHLQNMS